MTMHIKIKSLVKSCISPALSLALSHPSLLALIDLLSSAILSRHIAISHKEKSFIFSVPNRLTLWRVQTFSEKEPETLEWIDSFESNSVFFDVGANIGLYSVYAASHGIRTYAFEPSVFNLSVLAENISLNNLESLVTVLPLAVTDSSSTDNLISLSTREIGGALHTFQETYTFDGSPLDAKMQYSIPGFSLDDLILSILRVRPRYLKIDVDGIEHLILQGAKNSLKSIEQVQIEINDSFALQEKACKDILAANGFTMVSKKHSEMIESSTTHFSSTYNQVWINQAYAP